MFPNRRSRPTSPNQQRPLGHPGGATPRRITLEALYEVGYEIDVMMADPFTLTGARSARPRGPKMYLGIDIAAYCGPIATITMRGAVKKQ